VGNVVLTITAEDAKAFQVWQRQQAEQRKLAEEAAKVGLAGETAGRKTAAGQREAAKAAQEHKKQVTELREALGKVGGTGGALAGQMGKQFAAVGVSALVIGKAVSSIVDTLTQWAETQQRIVAQTITIKSEIEKTRIEAGKAAGQRAAGNLPRVGETLPLIAAGGRDLVPLLRQVTGGQPGRLAAPAARVAQMYGKDTAAELLRSGFLMEQMGLGSIEAALDQGRTADITARTGKDGQVNRAGLIAALARRSGRRATDSGVAEMLANLKASQEAAAMADFLETAGRKDALATAEAITRGPNAARKALVDQDIDQASPGYMQEVERVRELQRQAKIKRDIAERIRDESPNQLKYFFSGIVRGQYLRSAILEAQEAEAAVDTAGTSLRDRSLQLGPLIEALRSNTAATQQNTKPSYIPPGG